MLFFLGLWASKIYYRFFEKNKELQNKIETLEAKKFGADNPQSKAK